MADIRVEVTSEDSIPDGIPPPPPRTVTITDTTPDEAPELTEEPSLGVEDPGEKISGAPEENNQSRELPTPSHVGAKTQIILPTASNINKDDSQVDLALMKKGDCLTYV